MKKGYTLIELIVVLAIMAIFSSIAVINITKVEEVTIGLIQNRG